MKHQAVAAAAPGILPLDALPCDSRRLYLPRFSKPLFSIDD